jgi:hypothetical protein
MRAHKADRVRFGVRRFSAALYTATFRWFADGLKPLGKAELKRRSPYGWVVLLWVIGFQRRR